MNKVQAFYDWLSGSGANAYEKNCVPADAEYPFLTVDLPLDSFGSPVAATVELWHRDLGMYAMEMFTDMFGTYIGAGGTIVACDGGGMWIKRGSPWCVSVRGSEKDDAVRRRIFNLTIEFITQD